MLFRLSQVSFSYGSRRRPVFQNLDLIVPSGLSVLRGPSGGGKSTLLKLLAGYLPPQSGSLKTWHGKPPDRHFRRVEAGFVFQQFNLLPGVTLRKNLELAGLIAGVAGLPLSLSIGDWLERLGLEDFAEASIQQLSGGQIQRAALARALIKRPALLLLDEPTSGLDEVSTQVIGSVLAERLAAGSSVVVSTHGPRLAAAIGQEPNLSLAMPTFT